MSNREAVRNERLKFRDLQSAVYDIIEAGDLVALKASAKAAVDFLANAIKHDTIPADEVSGLFDDLEIGILKSLTGD